MRALNVFLSFLIVIVLTLLAIEGGLRLIGKGPQESPHRFDTALGWSKKPNHLQVREGKHFTAHIETNEQGLRDDPMPSVSKPADTFRVVMLGDSFTLGYTVEREDLFVDILEDRWNDEGRKVDVVNTGTAGYSTDQEARWLLENGEAYQPDLVVLLPYENDIFWNGQERYTDFDKPRFSADGKLDVSGEFDDKTGGFSKNTAIGKLFGGGPSSINFQTPGGATVPGDFAPLFANRPAVYGDADERTRGALKALRDECQRLGAELVVAPIPSNSAVDSKFAEKFGQAVFNVGLSEWRPNAPVDFFLEASRNLGITAVDVRPELSKAQAGDESLYHDFFAGDNEWHFNERGNRVFAQALYGKLDDLGLLPAKKTDAAAQPVVADSGSDRDDSEGGLPTWMYVFGTLWVVLSGLYIANYKDEPAWQPPLKIGLLLGAVFTLIIGGGKVLGMLDPSVAAWVLPILLLVLFGFIAYKLGNRLATIAELFKAFTMRGHWYLMPVVVVLLTIGSLLVVAASSPLVAPFIYTLF